MDLLDKKSDLLKFLPYENYILTTKLSVEEVLKRIGKNIEPRKNLREVLWGINFTKPYRGKINGTEFTIMRNLNNRNSFQPQIKGEVSSLLHQTEIKIKMTIWLPILIITLIPLVATIYSIVVILFFSTSYRIKPEEKFIPPAFLVFLYALTYISFKSESKKSKNFLTQLLEGIQQEC